MWWILSSWMMLIIYVQFVDELIVVQYTFNLYLASYQEKLLAATIGMDPEAV